jgi:16S rRNA (guanine(966)-N(2))-methyltransferase RsmD
MRIISGKYKGKRIQAPTNLPVRPTADMQKEALFNIVNNYYDFNNINVLDLFSGTGNIAYEFASRGTKQITVVDENAYCIKFINVTSKELDFPIDTIKSEVFQFLNKTHQQFDLIFADPPYDMDQKLFEKIPQTVFEKKLLTDVGMLIVEHAKQTNLEHCTNFSFSRNYGGSVFSFFEIK